MNRSKLQDVCPSSKVYDANIIRDENICVLVVNGNRLRPVRKCFASKAAKYKLCKEGGQGNKGPA